MTEGLETLLDGMRNIGEAAFIVVTQHDGSVDTAQLADRLTSASGRDTVLFSDGLELVPGRIHIAVPGTTATVTGRHVHVEPSQEPGGERGAIDSLLVSLAEESNDLAVGVILKGVNGDGTLGLTAVREHGGLTLAEADHEDDNGSAAAKTAAAVADFVLPVSEIGERIGAHLAALTRTPQARNFDELVASAAPHLTRIAAILRNRTGHDFNGYKHNTFFRRIQRRMHVAQKKTVEDYLEYLRAEPDEAQNLFNDLLIGVTQFFRDQKEFEFLAREVVPRLFAGKGASDHLRVWVLGCATGEEAYSIAILLREHMAGLDVVPHVQIFATDIDNGALAMARVGRYPASEVKGMPPERLARWFVKEGETFCVTKELREMCIFSQHNLIKDAPFSRLDLVSCRNLLIYLNAELQERVIPLFHFALRPGGFLFLGSSENVTKHGKLFAPVDRRFRIFRHVDSARRILPEFPLGATADRHMSGRVSIAARSPPASAAALTKQAERVMERYAPAYMIVDENHDVLHFSGRTGRFIDPSTGHASLNVLALVHRDLRMDLRTALHKAESDGGPVRIGGLKVDQNGKSMVVTLAVEPLDGAAGQPRRFAVILQDGPSASEAEAAEAAPPAGNVPDEHVRRLEEELRVTRDRLQATIEELESTNEELKASNEEYQSVNEELQSSNEELETSKEELQSLNEELQTVNGELASRVEELGRANSDLKNLLESTQIATIFLDNELRIKSFTPAIGEIFHVIESDTGRPIAHIARRVAYEDLEQDVRRIIRTLGSIEKEIESPQTGSHYLARILPYRSVDNVIDGAVVTFLDVTKLVRAEARLRESESLLRSVVEGIPQLVWRAGGDGGWTWCSPQWVAYTGQAESAAMAFGWLDAVHPDDRERVREAWRKARGSDGFAVDHRLWHRKIGDYRGVHLRAAPVRADSNGPLEWVGTITDVHEMLLLQERQNILLHELQHRVRNILAVVGSIAQRTADTVGSVQEYAQHLGGRIDAMSRTQNVLTGTPDARLDLRTLIEAELSAQGGDRTDRFALAGPEIVLSGKGAEMLSLVFHELATNALKYGALSVPGGRVDVTWRVGEREAKPQIHVTWRESGVKLQGQPARRGFGSDLIENLVPYELGGMGRLQFATDGLTCTLKLPLSEKIQRAAGRNGEMRISDGSSG